MNKLTVDQQAIMAAVHCRTRCHASQISQPPESDGVPRARVCVLLLLPPQHKEQLQLLDSTVKDRESMFVSMKESCSKTIARRFTRLLANKGHKGGLTLDHASQRMMLGVSERLP